MSSAYTEVTVSGPKITSPFTVRVPVSHGFRMDSAARVDDEPPPHCQCEPSQEGFGRVCDCTSNRGDRNDDQRRTGVAERRVDGAGKRVRRGDAWNPYLDAADAAFDGDTLRHDDEPSTVRARLDAASKDPAFDPTLFWADEYLRESRERGNRDAARRQREAGGPPGRRDVDDEGFDPYLDSADAAFRGR